MRNKIFLGLGLGMVIIVLAVLFNNQTPDQPAPNKALPKSPHLIDNAQVQVAPEFTLASLSGGSVSLADFRGKNVYLNFWASWCGPCRAEMPDIESIHREYQAKDLIVLTVNVGESQNTVQKFIASNNFTFPVLLDPANKVAKLYKVTSIPVSVFINKEGVMVTRRVGMMTKEQMVESISSLTK